MARSGLPFADDPDPQTSSGKPKRFLNNCKKELYAENPNQAGGLWDGGVPARSTRPKYPSLGGTAGFTYGGHAHNNLGGAQDHHTNDWCSRDTAASRPATGAAVPAMTSRPVTGTIEGLAQLICADPR